MASAAILLGVALTALERQVGHRDHLRGVGLGCPSGTESDGLRASRVRALLARTARGRQLRQQAARAHELCFGPPERSALVGGSGVVVLDQTLGDLENAARLGHLLSHATAFAALPDVGKTPSSCDEFVDGALRAEARAYAIERELRSELGAERNDLGGPRGEPPEALLGAVREASADGAPAEPLDSARSLPSLGRAYLAQCEAARLTRANAE